MKTRSVTRPGTRDLAAAHRRKVPDLIRPGLKVLFVGINPSLYSAAVRHHFARPGNRFWPTLYRAGLTPRLLEPAEERKLLEAGYGITNVVPYATAAASELTHEELRAGGRRLIGKLRRYRPAIVAVLGIGAYRLAFDKRHAQLGRQAELLGGCELWVLPNPSGLNANYQLADLARLFRRLRRAADRAAP